MDKKITIYWLFEILKYKTFSRPKYHSISQLQNCFHLKVSN